MLFPRIAGQSFGELALMYNAPRAATVVAATDGELWAVDRYTFRSVVVVQSALKPAGDNGGGTDACRAPCVPVPCLHLHSRIAQDVGESRVQQYVEFLKGVELLMPLAEYEREKIAEALEEVSYAPGAVVFEQGMRLPSVLCCRLLDSCMDVLWLTLSAFVPFMITLPAWLPLACAAELVTDPWCDADLRV